ncbi:hypothetical protein, partial [Pseudomonas sp. SWRI111]|uniref:hypothetical protein n=1 Tax=Pseudomonas sp. SWRI111 TaxID=2745507 RepID=UPI001EE1ED9B
SEWIEIKEAPQKELLLEVSLYMSEWIEIFSIFNNVLPIKVSLYMSEWIEMIIVLQTANSISCLTLYE